MKNMENAKSKKIKLTDKTGSNKYATSQKSFGKTKILKGYKK